MSADIQYCPECGSQNDGDAIFCASCGKKFTTQSSNLGQQTEANDQFSNMSSPQPTNFNQYNQGKPQSKFQAPEQGEVNGLIDASIKMITKPKSYALRLLSSPNAPNASYLLYIRALLFGLVSFLTFYYDDYFVEINQGLVRTQIEDTGLTLTEARELLTYSQPVISIIYVLVIWYVGSFLLGWLIKMSLHEDSPLMVDPSRSMRLLNGYRQIPRIFALMISVGLILTTSPVVYIQVTFFVGIIAEIGFAIILYRGLGEHVGYFGSVHQYIAALIIFVQLLQLW